MLLMDWMTMSVYSMYWCTDLVPPVLEKHDATICAVDSNLILIVKLTTCCLCSTNVVFGEEEAGNHNGNS